MNSGDPHAHGANILLDTLSPGDRALIVPHLERVPFVVGDVIAHAGERIEHVCFPENALAGVLDSLGDKRFAVGLIGREGVIGWSVPLGDECWPYHVVMRAERGTALRLPVSVFRHAVSASVGLRDTLLRYANTLMVQMGRTIVSSLAHSIERRMARWLLLYHDRVTGDEMRITHGEFGMMLGVRRSSVTDALHRLEEIHAVRSTRGRLVVTDRSRLLALAGDTYGEAERRYRRLIADPARA